MPTCKVDVQQLFSDRGNVIIFFIGLSFSSIVFITAVGGVGNVDSPTAHKWALDSSLVLLHLFLTTG